MSLKEQMLKAGLITEEEARRTTHKKRVEDKKSGHKARQQARETTRAEAREQTERQKDQDRQRSSARREVEQDKQHTLQKKQHSESALAAAYREGAVANWEGPRRYYYAVEGRIDYLMVTEDVSRRLERGQIAIAAGERNPARRSLLTAPAARKLREIDPARILVLHPE